MKSESLVCSVCHAPVSFLFEGVCARCADLVEPPLTEWREVHRRCLEAQS
jgi:hypothetical protein